MIEPTKKYFGNKNCTLKNAKVDFKWFKMLKVFNTWKYLTLVNVKY